MSSDRDPNPQPIDHGAPDDPLERFTLAVAELALGSGSLQERLEEAWDHTLPLRSRDIPAPLRPEFERIEAVWLSSDVAALDEGAAREAARAMFVMHVELLTLSRSRGPST